MTRRSQSTMPVLRAAILGLVLDKRRSGYDLARAFSASMDYAWTAAHSQIYPELAKMEAAGLVAGRASGIRRRRVYSATAAGRAALRSWLRAEPDRTERSEASLRLFMLWTLPTADQVLYLDREAAHHRSALAELEEIATTEHGTHNPFRLMLEWGIRYHGARLEWLAWAQNEIHEGRQISAGATGSASDGGSAHGRSR